MNSFRLQLDASRYLSPTQVTVHWPPPSAWRVPNLGPVWRSASRLFLTGRLYKSVGDLLVRQKKRRTSSDSGIMSPRSSAIITEGWRILSVDPRLDPMQRPRWSILFQRQFTAQVGISVNNRIWNGRLSRRPDASGRHHTTPKHQTMPSVVVVAHARLRSVCLTFPIVLNIGRVVPLASLMLGGIDVGLMHLVDEKVCRSRSGCYRTSDLCRELTVKNY